MAVKITQTKLDEMFAAYCEKQSIEYVARKCKVSHTTARRYKRFWGWDEKLIKAQQKASDKQVDTIAKMMADNIKMVNTAKNVYSASLVGKIKCPHCNGVIPVPKLEPKFIDLDKLIRLELLLRGQADARMEVIDKNLMDMSTEQLLRLREELNADPAGSEQSDRDATG